MSLQLDGLTWIFCLLGNFANQKLYALCTTIYLGLLQITISNQFYEAHPKKGLNLIKFNKNKIVEAILRLICMLCLSLCIYPHSPILYMWIISMN